MQKSQEVLPYLTFGNRGSNTLGKLKKTLTQEEDEGKK